MTTPWAVVALANGAVASYSIHTEDYYLLPVSIVGVLICLAMMIRD